VADFENCHTFECFGARRFTRTSDRPRPVALALGQRAWIYPTIQRSNIVMCI